MDKKIGKYLHKNMEKFQREGLMLHKDHPAPVTRRDLFSCGFYAAGYSLVAPSIGSLLLSTRASGQDAVCNLSPNVSGVPVLQVHFQGGRRLWGDGLAIGMAGDGDPSNYKKPDGSSSSTDFFRFGLSPAYHPSTAAGAYQSIGGHAVSPISYILQSARDVFGQAGLAAIDQKLSILSFAARSDDDSRSTKQNILPSATLFRGTADFDIISNSSGTEVSGLGNLPMFSVAQRANILSGADISALADTGLGDVDVDIKQSFVDTLFKHVAKRVSNKDAYNLLNCSAQSAKKKIVDYASEMNPFTFDATLAGVFDGQNRDDQVLGTTAHMLANNLALNGALALGGYDYHDSTSGGYDADRNAFANRIWKIINYFHQIGKPLIIYATSDGSTYCDNKVDPRTISIDGVDTDVQLCANNGDRSRQAGSFFMFLAGSAESKLNLKFHQVGYGTSEGSVEMEKVSIAGDAQNYSLVVTETLRRAMIALSGQDNLSAPFDIASGGLRFPVELETFLAL